MDSSLSAPNGALAPAVVVAATFTAEPLLAPLGDWGKHNQAGVRAFDVPGGHGSMLQEPHVATIAEILRSILSSAPTVAPAATVAPRGQAA